ncbi:MAG: fatty acid hydroxylase, partial [Orrella sp.]
FDGHYGPTGVHDQSHVSAYGQGFWAQQRLGLLRFLGVQKVV